MTPRLEPVPVSGIALCNALGATTQQVRDALHAGRHGLGTAPNPIPLPFPTAAGVIDAPLPELPDALQPWSTRVARVMFALLQQLEAETARLRERFEPHRIGVLLGTSTAGADVTEAAYVQYLRTGSLPAEYDLWRHHTYGAVLEVVRRLTGAEGPGHMTSTACTSSAKPLASAQRLMSAGLIDAAIVGGVDTLCGMTLRGFHSLDALSAKPCRPFSAERDGISIGEGGALLVLERGAPSPLALLESVGESSDAYHISAPHPEGIGAELSMRRALEQAGCDASAIDHINAHGTGTRLNDSAEAKAIYRVFGDQLPVVSTKAYTGHMLGGAGATEAALSTLPLTEGWLPAGLGSAPLEEGLKIHVPNQRSEGTYKRVLSNSFAFGGNNISVLLRSA